MGGRPRKPQEQKILEGTDRHDRTLENTMTPPRPENLPTAPKEMDAETAANFNRMSEMLFNCRVLKVSDFEALVQLARSITTMNTAFEEMNGNEVVKTKSGQLMRNPWTAVYNDAFTRFKEMASRFGLTPSDRQKIIAEPIKKENSLESLTKGI